MTYLSGTPFYYGLPAGVPDSFMSKDMTKDYCQNAHSKGVDYRGTGHTTLKGKTCQMWSSTSPHIHTFTNVGHHNYCRNPLTDSVGDEYELQPTVWCYTTDPGEEWDWCAVPFC